MKMATVRQIMLDKLDKLNGKIDALSRVVIPTEENLTNIYGAMDQMINWAERTIEVMRQQEEYRRSGSGVEAAPEALRLKY